MFRKLVGLLLLAPAAAVLRFAIALDGAWLERHVVLPAIYPPPLPSFVLPLLQGGSLLLGLLLLVGSILAFRRATWEGALRVGLALLLSLCASELGIRLLFRALPVPETRIEARLSAPDPRTGWSFVPGRVVDLPLRGSGRTIRYAIDAHGDRAPSADWVEDENAPTILVTGESIATGHGLDWSDTFGARLGELEGAQVVNVAEGGYGSDQAHLRAVAALSRLAHPLAVVTTVLPVQLYRNLHDDRPHLVERGSALILAPARPCVLRLREFFSNELPYLGEGSLKESLVLTRRILLETSAVSRARGARPLFVVPSFGPPRALPDHPEAFIVRALLDGLPYVLVDLSPERLLPYDGHPDPEGARQIARAIAAALDRPES